jgi:hypothetical protein
MFLLFRISRKFSWSSMSNVSLAIMQKFLYMLL